MIWYGYRSPAARSKGIERKSMNASDDAAYSPEAENGGNYGKKRWRISRRRKYAEPDEAGAEDAAPDGAGAGRSGGEGLHCNSWRRGRPCHCQRGKTDQEYRNR